MGMLSSMTDRATHKKMATDAMFKLEHGSDDVKKSKAVVMNLSSLEGRRDEWRDDYILNKIARQKFRVCAYCRVPTSSGNHGKPGKSPKKVPCLEKSWNLKKTE